MLFIADGERLALRASYGAPPGDADWLDLTADLFECDAFHKRIAVAVAEANGRSPMWLSAYKDVTSYAVAPIVRDERSVGVLVGAYVGSDNVVDSSDARMLQIFAYNIRGVVDDQPEQANPVPWRDPEH